MNNNYFNTILDGAKTLLGKKSTQDILRYLSTVTISHIAQKCNANKTKYDASDLKNMVYHHNMNNNDKIIIRNMDSKIDLMCIIRFINSVLNNNQNNPGNELIGLLAKVLNDNNVVEMYNEIVGNNILQQFDTDTVETSSIVDNYEISSGGIYIPDNDVLTSTIEGCNLANAKNDYLIQRLHLGQEASNDDVMRIINEYYKNIQYDKVNGYFNKGN